MPPAKRQRISRACEPCRKRKSKCDGEQPSCLMCQAAGRRCFYPNSTKRRGLKIGYVRGLETLLGLILQHYPETENQVAKMLRTSEARESLSGGDEGERYAQSWRTSASFKKVNAFIQNSSSFEPESDEEIMNSIAPEQNPSEISATPAPADQGNNNTPIQHISDLGQQLETRIEYKCHDFLEQPFPPNSSELMDEYFAFTHSWFPIVERSNVLRIMHKNFPAEKDRRIDDIGHRMSLWAIIAYTLATRSHAPDIPDSLQPQYIEMSIRTRAVLDDQEFSLGHIQAILILVLIRLKFGHLNAAWILVAQAARMVVIVGQRSKAGRYKQVFYGCVILDTFISTLLNQSSCLFEQEQDPSAAIDNDEDEEGVDEWDSWTIPSRTTDNLSVSKWPLRALSTFRRVYNVMCRISSIRSIRTPADTKVSNPGSSGQPTLSLITDEVNNLISSQLCLPSYCQFSECSEAPRPPLLILHLSLNFVLSTLLLRRRSADIPLVDLCKRTAKSTFDLIRQYIKLTGTFSASPMLIGFAVQARELLSNADHDDEYVSQAAAKLALGHHISNDRGAYWTPLSSQMGQSKEPTTTTTQHRSTGAKRQHDHGLHPGALSMTEADSLFVDQQQQQQQIPIDPLVLDTDQSTFTDTVAFDDLCEQMIATHQIERNSKDPLFARNLGFLDDSLDDDMLTFLQNPNTRSDYPI